MFDTILGYFPAIVIFVLTGLYIKGMSGRDDDISDLLSICEKYQKLCNLTPSQANRYLSILGAVDAYFLSGCSDIYLKELEKAYNGGKIALALIIDHANKLEKNYLRRQLERAADNSRVYEEKLSEIKTAVNGFLLSDRSSEETQKLNQAYIEVL